MKRTILLALAAFLMIACGGRKASEPIEKLINLAERAVEAEFVENADSTVIAGLEAETKALIEEYRDYELTSDDKAVLTDRLYELVLKTGSFKDLGAAEKELAKATAKTFLANAIESVKTIGDLEEIDF